MLIKRTGYGKVRNGLDNIYILYEDTETKIITLHTPFLVCNPYKNDERYNWYLNYIRGCELYELEITKNNKTIRSIFQ
jgi:hypothetical protein